jgi:hypothetical protein
MGNFQAIDRRQGQRVENALSGAWHIPPASSLLPIPDFEQPPYSWPATKNLESSR